MFTIPKRRWPPVAVLICVGLSILGILDYWYAGHRFNVLIERARATDRSSQELKNRMISAANEDSSTIDSYIKRCEHLGPAAIAYEPALRKLNVQLREAYEQAPLDARKQLDLVRNVLAIDLEIVGAARKEAQLASELRSMSPAQQIEFYNSKLLPVRQEQERLSREEVRIVKDARAAGIQIPESLSRLAD